MKLRNKIVAWDKHLENKYGMIGTMQRTEFEEKARLFVVSETKSATKINN